MQKQAKFSFFIVLLLLLSSCELFKGSKKEESKPVKASAAPVAEVTTKKVTTEVDSSSVLASIDGKPLVTEKQFEKYKRQFAQAQPAYAVYLDDPAIEEQIFEGQLNEKKLEQWAIDNKIDQKEGFKKD